MPKPANKAQVLSESRNEYEALGQFLETLTPEQTTRPGALGDWSVKDVIAHLLEWQHMFFGWYAAGVRGEIPPTPAKGYKWSQLPALNQMIYEKHRERPWEEIRDQFRASHQLTMELVQNLSEAELFNPGSQAWTGKNKLGAYVISITSSHYRWARTEMKKNLSPKSKKVRT
jgi:uncharacterized protein (TIGR03083 family)